MSEEGKVNIHGKIYLTVAYRVNEFRKAFADHSIITEIIENTDARVIMSASILNDGVVIATGHAEEYRASSQINKTSALENCETSAIGRALACLGVGGTEFASANEVLNAIAQQEVAYTPQQKNQFDTLMDGDSYSFWLFWSPLDTSVKTALFSTFTKPNITKNKDKVRKLEADGLEVFNNLKMSMLEHIDNGDSGGLKEIGEELAGGKALAFHQLSAESQAKAKELMA